jgi:hypothetical protein
MTLFSSPKKILKNNISMNIKSEASSDNFRWEIGRNLSKCRTVSTVW